MTVWVVAAALSMAAGLAIAWRLIPRGGEGRSLERKDYDVEVYRDQLRELDRDLDRGVVEGDEAEAARNEIRRRVLAAASTGDEAPPQRALSRTTIYLLAAAVPAISLGLYSLTGRPDLANSDNLTVQQKRGPTKDDVRAAARMTPEQRREMIRGMVDRLAARLKENPKDLAGWLRLGRARSVLGQHEKAAEAYARAAALAPKNVRVLTMYAMAVVRTQKRDGPIPPGVVALMKRLYELEPRHPLALYYLGKNAFDLGQKAEGRRYWQKLLPLLKDRPAFAAQIRKRLEQSGQ